MSFDYLWDIFFPQSSWQYIGFKTFWTIGRKLMDLRLGISSVYTMEEFKFPATQKEGVLLVKGWDEPPWCGDWKKAGWNSYNLIPLK